MENEQNSHTETPFTQEKWYTPLTRNTSVCRVFTAVLFVILPFLGFWLGVGYWQQDNIGPSSESQDSLVVIDDLSASDTLLYVDGMSNVYVLGANEVYVQNEYVSALERITKLDVPNSMFFDEELQYKLRLPDTFSQFQMEKTHFTQSHNGKILDIHTTSFIVDASEVNWTDTFTLFEIKRQPKTSWGEFGQRRLDADNHLVYAEADWVKTGDYYLAEDDLYVYTINKVAIGCPSKYRNLFSHKPLPTPHCIVFDAVENEIAETFSLLNATGTPL